MAGFQTNSEIDATARPSRAIAATILSLGVTIGLPASAETLTPISATQLPNVAGKAVTAAVVTFPPGDKAKPHHHGRSFVLAYVLEGHILSQIEGEPAKTYGQGQSWMELPGAHHLRTENLDTQKESRLLVIFIHDQGETFKTDDPAQ